MKPHLAHRLLAATVIIALFSFNVVTKAAGSFLWTNTAAGASAWNVPVNWSPNGTAGSTDTNIFGTNGYTPNATTIDSEVTVNDSISTLLYTNVNSGLWHVTQIPSGVTLTVVSNLTVGFLLASNNNATSSVAMVDAGTLQVQGNLTVGNSGTSAAVQGSILNLSGLSNFVYNSTSGSFNIGFGNRGASDFTFAAASNIVTVGTMNLDANSASSASSGTVRLGAGTNIINAGTINLGAQRSGGTLNFAGASGGLRLRGTGGTDTDRATVTIGNGTAGASSGGTTTGTLNMNGHPADMKLSTLTVGQSAAAGAAGNNIGTGNVLFDMGSIDATTVNMAIAGTLVTNTANGTLTVGATGTLTVGSGGVSLVNESVIGQVVSIGTLNVSGGVINCAGSVVKTTAIGTGNFNMTNATVTVGGTIGTAAIPVNSMVISNTTLQIPASLLNTNVVVSTLNALTGANNTINITSLPVIGAYPTQIPLISYTASIGDLTTFALGTLPVVSPIFQGYISNNTTFSRIDLVITNGPVPPPASKAVTWEGQVSGDWDTTTTNWLNAGNLTNYNNVTASGFGDTVTFDDTLLGTTNVNLTQPLSPATITVNTASNYFFTGSGKITGPITLTLSGSGALSLANSTANDFSGAIAINAGSLIYDQPVDVTVANTISGVGTLVKNHANTLTLSGANNFSGGLTINNGAVRASTVSGAGTSLITVNGGTFVAGAAHTNSFLLTNGIIGTSASGGFDMSTNQQMFIGANTTNVMYSADPQSPTVSLQFLVDGVMRGNGSPGGTVLAINAPTNSPDGGNGVRFRNTNAISDFNGTVIFTNNVKGELLLLTPASGSFSPLGSGSIVICAGSYFGTNGILAPATGGYTELNLRNNGAGSVTVGNNVAVSGSGAAVINALAGTGGITMGNLTIGSGQELIGYRATAPLNSVIFTSVNLNGTATISPHSTTFGATSQVGTDLTLGAITEQTSGSGIIMAGLGNLTLNGVNNYSGDTMIQSGNFILTGSASLANSPHIIIAGGSKFDVSTLSSTFALGASQVLSNSTSTAILSGSAQTASGTVSLTYASGTPSIISTNGTLTLSASTVFSVNNTGTALAPGSYKIISKAATGSVGSVAGPVPSSVAVNGGGIAAGTTASLQITSGELYLVVVGTPVFSGLTASQSINYGTASVTLGGTISAPGPFYPTVGETITVTINGVGQPTLINDSLGHFSINYNTSTLPYSAAPYTITYSYAGDTSFTSASDSSTALTVNQLVVSLAGTRAFDGTTNAAAAILSVVNKVGADDVSVASGVGGLSGAGVGAQAITSVGNLTLGGTTAGNYTLAGASGSVSIIQAATSVVVGSSKNPSGFNDSITFNATLPVLATGSVTFKTNAVLFDTEALTGGAATSVATSVLPRGTTPITVEYAGDVNYIGSTNSINQVVTNHPPTIANIVTNSVTTGSLWQGTILSLSNSAAWADVDGDSITLSSVGPLSANSVSVTNDSTSIYYTAPVTVEDHFSYVITDGTDTATGTVYLEAITPPTPARATNIVVSAGVPTIKFVGTPNSTNVVQSTTNILNSWVSFSTNVADGSGFWQVTDTGGTNSPHFYRSFQPLP